MIKQLIKASLCALAILVMMPACAQGTFDEVTFPETFVGTKENKIENATALSSFFEKLKEGKEQARVLHIGDSHIRGNFLPGNVRKAMVVTFGSEAMKDDPIGYNKPSIATETGKPGLVYSSIGINGATTRNFMKPQQLQAVKAQRPDLLILSFGTNESYGDEYNAERHAEKLQQFVAALRENCGDSVAILLTTPPGCFKKTANKDIKIENKFNAPAAETIANFALDNNLALWNLYEIAGGINACTNWKNAKLMQPDGVHFNTKGYELQGRLLGQAISKAAFNEKSFK